MTVTDDTKQAATYRQCAEQLRAVAQRMTHQSCVRSARKIADSYEALADLIERPGRRLN